MAHTRVRLLALLVLLVTSAMAHSSAPSPIKCAETPSPAASPPSPTPVPHVESPAASPNTPHATAPSPTTGESPTSPPSSAPSGPTAASSPAKAPGPSATGAVSSRLSMVGLISVGLLGAAFVI